MKMCTQNSDKKTGFRNCSYTERHVQIIKEF